MLIHKSKQIRAHPNLISAIDKMDEKIFNETNIRFDKVKVTEILGTTLLHSGLINELRFNIDFPDKRTKREITFNIKN